MQKITDQLIRDTARAQKIAHQRRNIAEMHRVHNAPVQAAAPEPEDIDLALLLALLAPYSAYVLPTEEKQPA